MTRGQALAGAIVSGVLAVVTVATPAVVVFTMIACGSPEDKDGSHKGTHQHGGGAPVDPKFAAVQPVIARSCGGCHNGDEERALDTPARLKSAQGRIASGNMPPGGAIDPADKAALLSF